MVRGSRQALRELVRGVVDHRAFVQGELAEAYSLHVDAQLPPVDVFDTHRLDAVDGDAAGDRPCPANTHCFHQDERSTTGHLAVVQEDVPGVLGRVPLERQRSVRCQLPRNVPQVVRHELRVDDVVEAVPAVGPRANHECVVPACGHQQAVDFGVEVFAVGFPVAKHRQATLSVWHRASLLL